LRNIYSVQPHLTYRDVWLVNQESPTVPSRVIYITRFGGLLPDRFCRSAPTWSARSQLFPRKRWLRPSGCHLIAVARAVER